MSDLHGCWREYREALEKIAFSSTDCLYIVGDILDRGPNAAEILWDVMARRNVHVLAGNHEYAAIRALPRFFQKEPGRPAQKRKIKNPKNGSFRGGQDRNKVLRQFTEQFRQVDSQELQQMIAFLADLPMYKTVCAGGRDYLLVHAGLEPFQPGIPLEEYGPEELLFHRADYSRPYFTDRYTVTGHTPTFFIDNAQEGYILHRNDHIAIDCGCVYGCRLGVYCLETGAEIYVDSERKKIWNRV